MAQASSAEHAQAAQAGLVIVLGRDIEQAWHLIDPTALRRTLPVFTAAIAALVHRYGSASAALAARTYLSDRRAAGITGPFTVRPAPLPPLPQVAKTVDWATQPLWSAEPDVKTAQSQVLGSADRLVLNVGRQTITDSVQRDRHAKGWARIPEPGCCAFCALLATRGAVYKQNTVAFKAHNHCRCHVEPVFTAYEPTAQIREWQGLYARSTRGVSGMKATQRAWRQAFDSTTT